MKCPFRMDTGAYALDILPPPDRIRMKRHLETCRQCRSDVAEFTAMLEPLRSISTRPREDHDNGEPANP